MTPAPQVSTESPPPTLPPAGWYPNPQGVGRRYWDGSRWTDEFTPPPAPSRKRHIGRLVVIGLAIVVAVVIARIVLSGGGNEVTVKNGSVGQAIPAGSDWTYRATDVWTTGRVVKGSRGARHYDAEYPAVAKGRFVVVALRATWRQDFEFDGPAQPVVLLGGDGKVYAEDETVARDFDRPFQAEEWKPGGGDGGWGRDITYVPRKAHSGVLVFDVPPRAASGSKLELEPNDGELIRIDLGLR